MRAATLATITTASIDFSVAAVNAAGPVVCMTDEGQGRYVACDSAYKAQALERPKQQQK